MKRDIIALGEILIDFTPVKNESGKIRFEQNAGGAPINVLAALAKQGISAGFIGCVGNDQFGSYLNNFLGECNIDNKYVKISDKFNTTLAFVHLKEDGDREFSFYRNHGADLMISEEEIKEDIFNGLKVFHFGSLSLTDEPARSATLKAIRIAKQKGCLISYDPNLRPLLWRNLDDAKKQMLNVMDNVNILKISEDELEFLTDVKDIEEGSKQIYDKYNIQLVIITLGPNGCAIRQKEKFAFVEGVKVKAVDTTGAGDSHLGAMLFQIIKAEEFSQISFDRLLEFGRFANYMAAYVTTKYGSAQIMPDFKRVEEAMKKGSW